MPLFLQVSSLRQTTLITTHETLRRLKPFKWRVENWSFFSSHTSRSKSLALWKTAQATMSWLQTEMEPSWWTRAAVTPQVLQPPQATSCRRSSWPTPTPWGSTSATTAATRIVVGASTGGQCHQVSKTAENSQLLFSVYFFKQTFSECREASPGSPCTNIGTNDCKYKLATGEYCCCGLCSNSTWLSLACLPDSTTGAGIWRRSSLCPSEGCGNQGWKKKNVMDRSK